MIPPNQALIIKAIQIVKHSQLDFYVMLNPQQQDPHTQRQSGTSSKSFM